MIDLLFPASAWAEGGGAPGGLGGLLSGPLPMLIIMFAIFYFLLIRPQQKKAKAHKEMLANLHKGDQIITSGGIYGRITGLTDAFVVVEIAPQVRIKVSRGAVSGIGTPQDQAQAANDKKKR
ncbi:preprotein translocase subunit YajC [Dethiosulfatarculus sandiegensis]|uniref:Sec translocon accessory complex subunit YajC n=1 Tax=Dethiosulfatarculus sandiegensis TaxID=1429043 RepID=A0A0D2JP95_9BACT|nr:preprotein translocase subunit YajC [Dethiosulfatarculus sandiegensis]KIX11305.1 preprotein translocase subunit YajC [Dethiosulfatarculus sandiegensis]